MSVNSHDTLQNKVHPILTSDRQSQLTDLVGVLSFACSCQTFTLLLQDTPVGLLQGVEPAPLCPPSQCVCVSSKPGLCSCLLVAVALFFIIPPAIRGQIPDITAVGLNPPRGEEREVSGSDII